MAIFSMSATLGSFAVHGPRRFTMVFVRATDSQLRDTLSLQIYHFFCAQHTVSPRCIFPTVLWWFFCAQQTDSPRCIFLPQVYSGFCAQLTVSRGMHYLYRFIMVFVRATHGQVGDAFSRQVYSSFCARNRQSARGMHYNHRFFWNFHVDNF